MEVVPESFVCQPRHVALIMDGNGRWARERSLPRSAGHRQGVEAVRRAVRASLELGIEYLTIYSFSAENWSRPAEEVSDLLGLLKRFIQRDVAELHGAGVKVRIIGERAGLSSDIAPLIEQTERLTQDNTKLTLVVAFNYGSRQEIAQAARLLAEDVRAGRLEPDAITPAALGRALYASDVPDPDLLIRTGGEQRLSNFLLWEAAYAELVFQDVLWPDYGEEHLKAALAEFAARDRRYGAIVADDVLAAG